MSAEVSTEELRALSELYEAAEKPSEGASRTAKRVREDEEESISDLTSDVVPPVSRKKAKVDKSYTPVGIQLFIRCVLKFAGNMLPDTNKKELSNLDCTQFAGVAGSSFAAVLEKFVGATGGEQALVDQVLSRWLLNGKKSEITTISTLVQLFEVYNCKCWLRTKYPPGSLPHALGGMTMQMKHRAIQEVLPNHDPNIHGNALDRLFERDDDDKISHICAKIYTYLVKSVDSSTKEISFDL